MIEPARLHRFTLIVPEPLADLTAGELADLAPEGFEEHEEPAAGGEGPGTRYVLYARPAEAEALGQGLRELLERLHGEDAGSVSLEVDAIPEENWREAWKVHFTLQRVPPFVIRPSWIPYEAGAGEHVIHLDPGSAFGTGLHETTRLCLRAIGALATGVGASGGAGGAGSGAGPRRVLDFGTGTGILGIAACLRFPCEVVAVDDDPLALTACDENAERNGVRERFSLTPALGRGAAPADLVLANVSRSVLVEHAAALVAAAAPGGTLVLSGLLVPDVAAVTAAFAAAGAALEERTQENDWVALRLTRGLGGGAARGAGGGAAGAEA